MRLFVTGTGTGVGKTLITAALTHQLIRRGQAVTALKPIISGLTPEDLHDSDTGVLLQAMGRAVSADEVRRISPWRYRDPISPDVAAVREGRPIDLDALVRFCRSPETDNVVVEGVGGIMVPLGPGVTVLDWAAALQWPTWLVAGSYLGTLSHTLTALAACRARGVAVERIVVSQSIEEPMPLDETLASLRAHISQPIVAVPRVVGPRPWTRLPPLEPSP